MVLQLGKQAIDLGIVTTNSEAMLAFYRDVIGLKYVRQIPMPGGGGVIHQLLCGESMIKIVSLESTPVTAPTGGIKGATGYRYWTITVTNVSELLQSCTDRGHPIVMKEREIAPGVRIAIVADPDGNWVEFLTVLQ